MLSAVEISSIVEVDRLTLQPNGITMTEEELVALAYELRMTRMINCYSSYH